MRQVRGFTLLEVLVALVIVALGLMAAFGQVNQTLTAASRLRDRTLAHWIALDQVTAIRLLGAFPPIGSESDEVEMANTRWRYTTTVTKTDFEDLRQVEVSVAFLDEPDRVISTVTGLLARAPTTGNQQPFTADWFPPGRGPGADD
jgi:general secretion pathway protein I